MRTWGPIFLLLGCGSPVHPPDNGDEQPAINETESPPDTQIAGSDDSNQTNDECPPDIPNCTCVIEPIDIDAACWHGHGGRLPISPVPLLSNAAMANGTHYMRGMYMYSNHRH